MGQGLLRLRTEILFSAMLLSSFFPEGIPFLPIEPNGLARNCIPPILSLLEENDTENTIHKKRQYHLKPRKYHLRLKIFYCYSGEHRLRKLTARNRDPCYSVLVEVPSDTADSIFLSFELAPFLVGRAQLLFSFPFFDRAQREASLANLVLKSLPSFLSKPEASLVDPAPAALSNAVTSITLILYKSMPVH